MKQVVYYRKVNYISQKNQLLLANKKNNRRYVILCIDIGHERFIT